MYTGTSKKTFRDGMFFSRNSKNPMYFYLDSSVSSEYRFSLFSIPFFRPEHSLEELFLGRKCLSNKQLLCSLIKFSPSVSSIEGSLIHRAFVLKPVENSRQQISLFASENNPQKHQALNIQKTASS